MPVHQYSSQEKRNNLHLQVDKCQLLNVSEKLLQQIMNSFRNCPLCVFLKAMGVFCNDLTMSLSSMFSYKTVD